ncbi:hypothetical protein ACJX0J_009227 [Zea mays]
MRKNMNMYFGTRIFKHFFHDNITCFISESGTVDRLYTYGRFLSLCAKTVEIMLQVNYMICMQIESQMTYNLEWRDYCRLKKHIVYFLDNKTNSLSLKHQFIVELQNVSYRSEIQGLMELPPIDSFDLVY